jgi:hypothetical protein
MRTLATQIVALAGVLALAATPAAAQQTTGAPSWQAWIGCWTTAPGVDATVPTPALVCITPTSDAAVAEVTTIAGKEVVSTRQIDAAGREQPISAKGCTGTQQAWWSSDGRRIYLKSSGNCGGLQRTTTGILAMTPRGDWLDIQGIAAGDGENVRVARYHDAGIPSSVPVPIADALRGRGVATESARIAAGAAVHSADVMEASRAVSPAVTEAWLLERGQAFALDARELVRLADAGVPPRVTDAMIAVSNPDVFAVAHQEVAGSPRMMGDTSDVVGQRIRVYMEPGSPWDWGYAPGGYGYGYGYNSPYGFGYNGFGYGYTGGYGYPGGYGYYGPPVIIVGSPQNPVAHGRIVKGQGYRSDPSAPPGRGATSGSSASSPGASASSTRASAPAPAPARTAQPKP